MKGSSIIASVCKPRRTRRISRDAVPLPEDIGRAVRWAMPEGAERAEKELKAMFRMHTLRRDLYRAGIPHHDERGKKNCLHSLPSSPGGDWSELASPLPSTSTRRTGGGGAAVPR